MSFNLGGLFVVKDESFNDVCDKCKQPRLPTDLETDYSWVCSNCGHDNQKADELYRQDELFQAGQRQIQLTSAELQHRRILRSLENHLEKYIVRMKVPLSASKVLPLMKSFFERYHWPRTRNRIRLYSALCCYIKLAIDQESPRIDEFIVSAEVPRLTFVRWLYKICDLCHIVELPKLDFRRLVVETVRRLVVFVEADLRGENALALLPNTGRYRPAYRNKRRPRIEMERIEQPKRNKLAIKAPDSSDVFQPTGNPKISEEPPFPFANLWLKLDAEEDPDTAQDNHDTTDNNGTGLAPSINADYAGMITKSEFETNEEADRDMALNSALFIQKTEARVDAEINHANDDLDAKANFGAEDNLDLVETNDTGVISEAAGSVEGAAKYDLSFFDLPPATDYSKANQAEISEALFNEGSFSQPDQGIFEEVQHEHDVILFDDLFSIAKHEINQPVKVVEQTPNIAAAPRMCPALMEDWVENVCLLGTLCEVDRITTPIPIKSKTRRPDPIYTLISFVFIAGRMTGVKVRQKDLCTFFRVVKANVSATIGIWLDTLVLASLRRGLAQKEHLTRHCASLRRERREISGRILSVLHALLSSVR
eukprot:Gregarina_sp_Poly_1__2637@NODE_171_length_12059_cov_195_119163_g152_i0_p2_GENE_NODE_171_length_12059_cov_195_119163_g152_i0NODE_171_length_12059_cov_195_119163_g152_i0_p2_ORF_typecomplete_len596_score77_39OMS28_porin/PF03532_13/0_08DZR/PF12773_7/0_46zfRanBP/PF00641_18/37zfRanBP/PF00641_18/5_NODE_171_length_12059_cov_195_119163_g152_i055047291